MRGSRPMLDEGYGEFNGYREKGEGKLVLEVYTKFSNRELVNACRSEKCPFNNKMISFEPTCTDFPHDISHLPYCPLVGPDSDDIYDDDDDEKCLDVTIEDWERIFPENN